MKIPHEMAIPSDLLDWIVEGNFVRPKEPAESKIQENYADNLGKEVSTYLYIGNRPKEIAISEDRGKVHRKFAINYQTQISDNL